MGLPAVLPHLPFLLLEGGLVPSLPPGFLDAMADLRHLCVPSSPVGLLLLSQNLQVARGALLAILGEAEKIHLAVPSCSDAVVDTSVGCSWVWSAVTVPCCVAGEVVLLRNSDCASCSTVRILLVL